MSEGKRILISVFSAIFVTSCVLIVLLLLTHSDFACAHHVNFYPCGIVRLVNSAIPWGIFPESSQAMKILLGASLMSFVMLFFTKATRLILALLALVALSASLSDHLSWFDLSNHIEKSSLFRSLHLEDGRLQVRENDLFVNQELQRLNAERENLEQGIGLITQYGALCPGAIDCGFDEPTKRQLEQLEYELEAVTRDIQYFENFDFENATSIAAENYIKNQSDRLARDINRGIIATAAGSILLYAGSSGLMLVSLAASVISALAVRSQALYIPEGYAFDWLYLVIPFATFLIVMLFAVTYISSNNDIFKKPESYLKILGLSAIIILPAIIIFGVMNFGLPKLIESAISQIECDDKNIDNCLIRNGISIIRADRPIGIIDSVFYTIEVNIENEKEIALTKLDDIDEATASSAGSTADNLSSVYDEVIPGDYGSIVPRPQCRRHPFSTNGISCYFEKGSWNALNRVYSNSVDRGRREYIAAIQRGEGGVVMNTHMASTLIRGDINRIYGELGDDLKAGIAKVFGIWSTFSVGMFILASVGLVGFCLDRTYIIFGSQKNSSSVPLFQKREGAKIITVRGDVAEPMPMKNIDLNNHFGSKFYFPRAIRFAGQQDNLRLWASKLSPIFRLTSGRLLLNEAVASGKAPVRVKFDSEGKGNYFAAIELHESERYIMKRKFICGTTPEVRVRRTYSLRLPLVKCFGFGACIVDGPGIVILRSERRFEFLLSGKGAGVSYPEDIVFTSASAEVVLGVEGRLINYYWARPKVSFGDETYFGEVS